MANNKFDYSDDLAQDTPQCDNEVGNDEARLKAEVRNVRLEERNNTLVSEFRRLKPEIVKAHTTLQNITKQTATLSATVLTLLDLLKTALPLKLSDDNKKMLQDELNAIAGKAAEIIRRHEERVSMPQVTFCCMAVSFILFSLFFGLVIFANVKLIHSGVLTEIIVVFSLLFVLTLAATVFIFYKQKH